MTTILFFGGLVLKAQEGRKKEEVAQKKGVASYYHEKFVGRKTATGEVFNNDKFTAACNKLELGTFVKVTNVKNGNVVYVRINDRMAPRNNRLIDLASVAAEKLNFLGNGIAKVIIEVVSSEEGKTGVLAQREIEQLIGNNKL